MFFEDFLKRVRVSLLFVVLGVLVCGHEHLFGSACLLCLHFWDLLSFLFVFFCVFVCVVFCNGFCLFFVFQFSSSSWDCLSLFVLSSCRFLHFMFWFFVCLCGFLGCVLTGTISGGRLEVANQKVSIYFPVFFHNTSVWVKTSLPPRQGFSPNCFVAETCNEKVNLTDVFQFYRRKCYKIRF